MNKVPSLLLLLSFPVLQLYSQTTVFFDDFSSNAKNWAQSTSGGSIYFINNGKMIMENSDDGSRWVGKAVYLNTAKNYSISVSATHTGGIDNYGYGLFFGAKDGNNGYAFEIAANGHYILLKFENGQTTNLVNWTKSGYIRTGNYTANDLLLKKEDGYWKLYVNNSYLTSVYANSFLGDYIGFINYKNQRVEFDNLTVSEWDASSSGGSGVFKELFYDDFTTNINNWATSSTDAYNSRLQDGKFVIDVTKEKESYSTFRTIELDETKDYTISLSAMHASGVDNYGYGIIFGLSDMQNCYEFRVSANGMYSVLKYENGNFSWLINPASSSYINKGNYYTNDLMIKKTGSTWNFYINNQWVNSYSAQKFFASKYGMVVAEVQRVEFDNFKISGVSKYASTTTSTTTTIPDYTGGTKIRESGNFCNMFSRIVGQSADRFKQFTGPMIKEAKYDKDHESTLTITDATRAYVSHASTYSTFKIDFGEYNNINDAVSRIEQVKAQIENCMPKYKIIKSISSTPGSSTYYFTEKTSNGIINTGYYLFAASKTGGAVTSYTATLYIPDKPFSDTYTYLTNEPVASEFATQLKKLIQESKTNFKNIKGDEINDDDDAYSKTFSTSFKLSGTKKAELKDLIGVLDYYGYFEKDLTSEQAAKQAHLNLVDKVKKALGNKYMYKISELSYSKKYQFCLKNDITGSTEMVEVELYTTLDNTYDVRLLVLGQFDNLF